ncbi:fibronectin type III domain-containing protein [Myxococcus sp. K38C18041901]|uniref:fibronectin type III domain-containing protein n=1 Tax=Myxococcus guangdongensis TaxID=2906760 RepID=UPI0020A83180|nr:fibronectin type III domain-containing protein [Myxococcus guangdongensis]MCP3057745.1 fibronectin type III domain-containing protein [Myxococcus guangdongensis]
MSRSPLLGTACVLWLAGCGSERSDVAKASSSQAPLAEDEVWVTSTTRFHTSVGVAERLEDLSENPPEIYLQSGASFTRITGTAAAGGWRFRGVPRTEYYLRLASSYRVDVVTSARHVDIGAHRIGRSDAEYPWVDWVYTQLDLRNLSPWRHLKSPQLPGSSLHVVSTDVETFGELIVPEETPEGATSIETDEALLFAYNTDSLPIFRADAGDRLYVHQLSEFIAGALPDGTRAGYSAIERSVHLPPLDFVPDWEVTPLPITTELQPLPLQEVPLDWRLSEFARLVPQVNARALPGSIWFEVLSTPHTSTPEQRVAESLPMLRMDLPRGSASDFAAPLRFGNPYPSDWGVVGRVNYSTTYDLQRPDNPERFVNVFGGYSAIEKLEDLTSGPIVPKLSPPRSLRIDWKSANTPHEVDSVHPVISWRPPAVGHPTAYEVVLRRYYPMFGVLVNSGIIDVPASVQEVRLPPDRLEPGTHFVVSVIAIDAPLWDVEQAPVATRERAPYRSSMASSAFFSVAP